MANLLEALGSRVVVGDGAVAAYLYAEGVSLGRSFEGLNLTEPDRVSEAHRAYLEAGAELIATNSFAAGKEALKRHGLEGQANEINWKASKLAAHEVGKSGAWVAGCIGPSGLAREERSGLGAKGTEDLFRSQAGALIDGGAGAILLQAFGDPEELEIAIGSVRELHHLPVIALLSAGREGTLPG
ncbi:MAG: bifunctional homocysteine S-methyltransferase/methylenetetrahydrofolate reductase, partial [Verrucomicrobia bacterium]|nr:bifunctional homocysteine S-methyltransferase/methylenetetrahydrofolate reductase [Verrucomicrobiota bacterium]